jgi:hypothetical protein
MLASRPRGRPRKDNGAGPVVAPVVARQGPVVWTCDQPHDPFPLDTHLSQAVNSIMRADRPANSKTVKEPKLKEFKAYCVAIYPDGPSRWSLWSKKIYLYMFYQAMRPQRKRGGKGGNQGHGWDTAEYNHVLQTYSSWMQNPTGPPVGPAKPIGISQFVHYMMGVKEYWEDLCARDYCKLSWDLLWTLPLKNLHKYVKSRKESVRRANYMEKLDHEFAPYQAIADFPKIEEAFWEKGALNNRSAYAYLRHRFCLLFSTSGILRCESLYKAELSDFLGLSYKQETDVHAFYMMIMQISTGKLTVTPRWFF